MLSHLSKQPILPVSTGKVIPIKPNATECRGLLIPFGQITEKTGKKSFLQELKYLWTPDLTVKSPGELTPEILQSLGDIKAVIFDLDDTLIKGFSGKYAPEILECLTNLEQAGLKVGVLTNNVSGTYCHMVRKKLDSTGLTIPFIIDAYKPSRRGFNTMGQFLDVKPSQMVMVGDGIFTDTYGARRAGVKSIRSTWFCNGPLKQGFFLWLREIGNFLFNLIRGQLFSIPKPQILVSPLSV